MSATWPWIKSSPFGKSGTKSANRDLYSRVEQHRTVAESVPGVVATGLQRLERNRLGCPSEYDASEDACAPVPVATAPGTDSISNPIEKAAAGTRSGLSRS